MRHVFTPAAVAVALVSTTLVAVPEAQAQRRAVVRPAGRPVVVVRGYYAPIRPFYRPYYRPYYGGLFYDPWYDPFWPAPPGYYAQAYRAAASVRLEVTPREAEVFVDGYYAGIVDNFDGVFQRLQVEPGEHDIEIYLPNYRTVRERIYVQPGTTFRIRQRLEPLGPGDVQDPRPSAAPQPPPVSRRNPPPGRPAARALPERPPDSPDAGEGTLAIRVQPGDAEVFVDGERWRGPAADEQLILQVVPGRHHVEVRRDGYRTFATEVTVSGEEPATLNVSLTRQ